MSNSSAAVAVQPETIEIKIVEIKEETVSEKPAIEAATTEQAAPVTLPALVVKEVTPAANESTLMIQALADAMRLTSRRSEPSEPVDTQPYTYDSGKTKMVYLPYDVRVAMYESGYTDDLINTESLHTDETRIPDAAHVKMYQRKYALQASALYVNREDVSNFLLDLNKDNEKEAKIFAKVNAVFTEIKDYFDEVLKGFFDKSGDGAVSYDELLVGLNTAGMLFSYFDGNTTNYFLTKKARTVQTMFSTYLEMTAEIHVNYGKGIQKAEMIFKLPVYSGSRTLSELNLRCLEGDTETLVALIKRGKKYIELTSAPAYMKCNGTLVRKDYWSETSYKAKGRIMVDYRAMKSMDPNYNLYFGVDRYRDRDDNGTKLTKDTVLPDNVYATCAPYVYGFSFVSKQWGEMKLDDLEPIQFRDDAYDLLVMNSERKKMIRALVETTYTGKKDVIDGKGGGCIFLLAGTPGVGKTLTAETVAELLQRPLYMVGVGELGTNVRSLEENLRSILEIATTWNAVLLIDEADIFMEERSKMDVERNAMVGIFLRLLEYYEGVLFLTTNRAKNIDQAFFSRISMSIHYDKLTVVERAKIWSNLSAMYDVKLSAEDKVRLADVEINGRQIKNTLRLAKALATADKFRAVEFSDVQSVLDQSAKFNKEMRGGLLSRFVKYVKKLFD
ncbi:ATPase family [compost metagenome]